MKKRFIASAVVFSVFSILMYGQVTEGEGSVGSLVQFKEIFGVGFSYNF